MNVHLHVCCRYAPRTDCGSSYHIRVELLNQSGKPVQIFAPKTIYIEQWTEEKWNQVWTEHKSFIYDDDV